MTFYNVSSTLRWLRGNDIGTVSRCSLRSFLEGKTILTYICLPFYSPTQASQLTGTSSYYRFRCYYPLITYLSAHHMVSPFFSTKVSQVKTAEVLLSYIYKNRLTNSFLWKKIVTRETIWWANPRTTDAQWGNCLHCMAENQIPILTL